MNKRGKRVSINEGEDGRKRSTSNPDGHSSKLKSAQKKAKASNVPHANIGKMKKQRNLEWDKDWWSDLKDDLKNDDTNDLPDWLTGKSKDEQIKLLLERVSVLELEVESLQK